MNELDLESMMVVADEDDDLYSGASDDWTTSDEDESYSFADEDIIDFGGFALFNNGLVSHSANELKPRQLNLLSDITKMKQQLQKTSEQARGMPKQEKYSDESSSKSTHSQRTALSVDAIAKSKNQKMFRSHSLKKSASTTYLPGLIVDITQNVSAQDEDATDCIAEEPGFVMKPFDYLLSILKSEGLDDVEARSASSLDDFFFEWADDNITAYESDLVDAIRTNNIIAVEKFNKQGRKLLCCNKFGESVVHMICRHGLAKMLEYFMEKANVTIRLKCDSGRTPLHDACWTNKPNFDCVRLLLEACPDLLLITDNRGFTPLSYVPRNSWGDWCSFLEKNKHLLQPRELV